MEGISIGNVRRTENIALNLIPVLKILQDNVKDIVIAIRVAVIEVSKEFFKARVN